MVWGRLILVWTVALSFVSTPITQEIPYFLAENERTLFFLREKFLTSFPGAFSCSGGGGGGGVGARMARMAQRWEHSPPINVARVQILASTPYVGVEFVVGSLPCSEGFFSGYSGFPLSSKPTFSNSNSTRNQVDKEPLCGCATSKSLYIFIYYYIYLFLNLWSRLDFCRSLAPPRQETVRG